MHAPIYLIGQCQAATARNSAWRTAIDRAKSVCIPPSKPLPLCRPFPYWNDRRRRVTAQGWGNLFRSDCHSFVQPLIKSRKIIFQIVAFWGTLVVAILLGVYTKVAFNRDVHWRVESSKVAATTSPCWPARARGLVDSRWMSVQSVRVHVIWRRCCGRRPEGRKWDFFDQIPKKKMSTILPTLAL